MEKDKAINKMGSMPMKMLLINMGVPAIFSMMLQAAYNIVDSYFVSNMPGNGEAALNALTLAFPVQMFMVALGIGTGVGMNAMLSKCLGQGDRERASKASGNALFMGIVIYLVFLLFGLVGIPAFVKTQTENPQIIEMATTYLRICCILSFGNVGFLIVEKLLQATGRSNLSTISQISGAATNIILDPILIYGLLGLPELGVAGAAWATVIGQIVALVVGMAFHYRFNKEIKNGLSYMKPSASIIKGIYAIGFPAIIAQGLMSIMTYGLNIILGAVAENAVTAYGLYYKVQQFILFAAFGMRDTITPVVSFNYGMGSKKRVNEGIRLGMVYTLAIMIVGVLLLEILAVPFTSIFGLSGETSEMCVAAMRIISISILFAGANIAFQGVFQALHSGIESLVISVCRQFLFILPVAWAFSLAVRTDHSRIGLVWSSFIIAEGLSVILAFIFMKRIRKDRIDAMAGGEKV